MTEQTEQEGSYPEDHAMEYLQPIRGNHQSISHNSQTHWKDDDDDSRCFMSEPSLSEDEGNPQPNTINLPLLSPQNSLSEGADDPPSPTRPAIHQPSPNTLLSSPGNTSLSSRDSPHLHKRIQLQFGGDNKRTRPKTDTSGQASILLARPVPLKPIHDHSTKDDDTKKSGQALSSRSASSMSVGQQLRATEFLEDLKMHSVGAVQDAASNDFDSDARNQAKADANEINTVIRMREATQNPKLEPDNDETLVMVLSDSEGEGTTKSEEEPLDWEQQHSADDEQTLEQRPRRRRIFNIETKHRRTRSGDGVAANMLTGSLDWKGMQEDMLPVPPKPDGEDDDEDDTARLRCEEDDSVSKKLPANSNSAIRFSTKAQGTGEHSSEESSITGFSVGTSTQNNRFMRKKRKAPRPQSLILERNDTRTVSVSNWEGGKATAILCAEAQVTKKVTSPNNLAVPVSVGFGSSNSSANESLSTLEVGSGSLYINRSNIERGAYDARYPVNHVRTVHTEMHARISELSQISDDCTVTSAQQTHTRKQLEQNDNIEGGGASVFSWITNRNSVATDPQQSADQNTIIVEDVEEDDMDTEEQMHVDELNMTSWINGESVGSIDTYDAGGMARNQMNFDPCDVARSEELFEEHGYHSGNQSALRSRISPYFTRPTTTRSALDKHAMMRIRASFKPVTNIIDENTRRDYPTFVCPQCGTRQREFFTVSSAPSEMQGPAGYLAFYFGMYVIASLYIFGLEEGWDSLDCVYFAVTTLMTAGLGDLVPTTDTAKIICSIFIYFGVACIGLLLGTYLANMLDERSKMQAMKTRVNNCVICSETGRCYKSRRSTKHSSLVSEMPNHGKRRQTVLFSDGQVDAKRNDSGTHSVHQSAKERRHQKVQWRPDSATSLHSRRPSYFSDNSSIGSFVTTQERDEPIPVVCRGSDSNLSIIDRYGSFSPTEAHMTLSPRGTIASSPRNAALGSPMTTQILGRQSHTRHISLDATNSGALHYNHHSFRSRIYSEDDPAHRPSTIHEAQPSHRQDAVQSASNWDYETDDTDVDDELSVSSEDDTSEMEQVSTTSIRIKTAKYVFLTLRQALMNSILIIAIGSIGFHYIEEFSLVDSFYFTTVLLTTVGFGDLVPVTSGGKIFATIYLLLAGTVLLNNMSLISMIPLELRKRRIERAVLNQFGDQLDDVALRELATGPLVRRLQLSVRRSDGLDECTREMFALAMLVRLGKVTERDIKMTFAAFRKLDVDNEGVLNSRTIITGMMHKKKSMSNLRLLIDEEDPHSTIHVPPPPPIYDQVEPNDFWINERGQLHRTSPRPSFHYGEMDPSDIPEDERAQLLASGRLHTSSVGYYGVPREH